MGTDDDLLRQSTPNATGPDRAAGGMGVSSEREGPTGGEHATDGTKDTSLPPDAPDTPAPDADEPPEQRPGHPEQNPEGIAPKAGYPSVDPRS